MSAVSEDLQRLGIEEYLRVYGQRDLLRLLTCGSVDDGKSTLIGRILHDAQMVYDDQLAAVRRDTLRHGTTGEEVDFALLMDGLEAEREQGITIDVAYRYFATPRRKFIIADTPGHEQYTRNMATGASTCNLAIILVDARKGVLDQTRRHAFIASLLGIKHLVVAVNKMDLVGYSQSRFEEIRDEFTGFAAKLQAHDIDFIPLSALRGENVVNRSDNMPWYQGSPLLDYLETVHIAGDVNLIDLRLPVQYVLRQSSDFRGYCGTIASGVLRKGQEVLVLPAGVRSHVATISTFDGELDEAFAPMAVTVTLDENVDVSRGDMFVSPNNVPHLGREIEAMLVWMSQTALVPGREYLIKQTSVHAPAIVADLRYRINFNTLHREEASGLALNEIGRVRIETPRLLAYDAYTANRGTGAFILIDRISNETLAAGMILDRDAADAVLTQRREGTPPVLVLEASDAARAALEKLLRDTGVAAWSFDARELRTTNPTEAARRAVDIVTAMRRVGVMSILPATPELEAELTEAGIELLRRSLRDATEDAALELRRTLERDGLLPRR
jgi:bifunctional enzyme CysN/CysC